LPRLLVLLAVVAATFGRALTGGFVYDDLALFSGSGAIARGDVLAAVTEPLWGPAFPHWRPLTQALLAAGQAAGGAAAIHVLVLLVHAAAVLAASRLAAQLTGSERYGFLVALLFAVHPAHAESVAWCAALNDVLVGACALAAMRAHAAARARGRPGLAGGAVGWVVVGLLAKETALVVPLLLLAMDALRLGGPVRPRWRAYLVFAGVLLPWLLLRVLVYGDWRAGFDRGPDLDLGGRSPWLLPFEILGRLLAVLVWPFAPSPMRPMPADLDAGGLAFAAAGALAVGAVAAAAAGRRRRVAFGLLLVLLPLALPALRPATAGEYPVADRYLYLPAFGLSLLLVPAVARWRAGEAAVAAVAAACAVRTWLAVGAWHSQEDFVRARLARGEDARVLYMAGQVELSRPAPDLDRARAAFERAAELARAPRFGGEEGRARLAADAEVGLGWTEMSGPHPDFRRAAALFASVLARHEKHPQAHVGLAACLAEAGDLEAAEQHLLRALELEPGLPAAQHNLARVRAMRR
jgi:hypothetical protein